MLCQAPSQKTLTRLVTELRSMLRADQVLTDSVEMLAYECDAYTIHKGRPDVVVHPESTEQCAAVVRLCARMGVPFTPRGTGTGLSGGATPLYGGVVISIMRMNRVLSISPADLRLRAQAGCINSTITRAVAPYGLHYAPDPSSQTACTVGGNVAENASGPHTLKYGVTANQVTALTLVLPDGSVVELGSDADEPCGYDLVGLLVGSEGTLGIVTEVTVRLTPNPREVRTLLAVFGSVDDASRAVSRIIAAGIVPCALEMMDSMIINALEDAFAMGFPRDAQALLLVELDGLGPGLDAETADVSDLCAEHNARSVTAAASEEERARLWFARKQGVGVLGRVAPNKVTQDGVIPRSLLPEVLARIRGIAESHSVRLCNIFHAGDGNLHPCVIFDERDADELRRVLVANEEILRLCVEVGGSITGEHGVGVEKRDAMPLMFSEADLAAMRRVKSAFDPAGLCNPGKIIPGPSAEAAPP
jgi:glycolate oxidase subunit GlcD